MVFVFVVDDGVDGLDGWCWLLDGVGLCVGLVYGCGLVGVFWVELVGVLVWFDGLFECYCEVLVWCD